MGRNVVLTDFGTVLAEHAERILAAEQSALDALRAVREEVAAPLLLGKSRGPPTCADGRGSRAPRAPRARSGSSRGSSATSRLLGEPLRPDRLRRAPRGPRRPSCSSICCRSVSTAILISLGRPAVPDVPALGLPKWLSSASALRMIWLPVLLGDRVDHDAAVARPRARCRSPDLLLGQAHAAELDREALQRARVAAARLRRGARDLRHRVEAVQDVLRQARPPWRTRGRCGSG